MSDKDKREQFREKLEELARERGIKCPSVDRALDKLADKLSEEEDD